MSNVVNINGKNVHPLFTRGERVSLVERVDKPGSLGVARAGGRFVCALPDGYDMDTSITISPAGYLLVAHPHLPSLVCDPNTGSVKLIHPGHVEAVPGRMKLITEK